MAYGLLLYKQIETPSGIQRLEIYKDGYAGSSVEIVGLHRDGISISKDSDNFAQPITTSVLNIRLNDCGEIDYSQFFTPNSTLFKVIWKTNAGSSWETRWTGFITPDSFKENLVYRDMLTLTARDNLGRMGDYDFSLPKGQMLSVRDIVNAGLAVAGVAMTTTWTTTKVATSPATVLVVDGLVNTSLLQGMTWREAVELLLAGLGLTLAWNDGNHFEVRDISQAPAASQTAFFVNNSGFRQIRPAWKNLTISQSYGLRDSFYEGQFTKDDCGGAGRTHKTFTPPSGSKWSKTGSVALMNPYNGTQAPYETLFMPLGGEDTITDALVYTQNVPAMDRTVTISMKLNNTLWYTYETVRRFGIAFNGGTHQSTAHLDGYTVAFRFNVFLTYGNTKYVLRENWEVYDPADTEDPYLYFNMPWTRDGVNQFVDASISIDSIPEDGVLEFVVYKPLMYLFNGTKENSQPIMPQTGYDWYGRINEIKMSIGESVTGRTNLIAINGSHNVQETIEVVVGQVPPKRGGFLLYYGGLFYDNAVREVLSDFRRSSSAATDYSLLELLAREHITFNNDNYDLLSGDMMTSGAAFRFDKLIACEDAELRIIGASLNILENLMSVTVVQTEAEFTTDAYSITEVDSEGDYSSSGGSYSGGATQGGGSQGDQFFAAVKDPTTSETVGAKALYDLLIIQTPADEEEQQEEVTKNITEILRHLRLETVTDALGNQSTILVSNITFASEKNTVAGWSGGSGGGTGGGSIATLADVTLTDLADRNILRYDALSGHWVNEPLSLSLGELSDVALGTPLDGQSLVYDATAGKWKPVTVGGGGSVTVISNDATIGTALTTLGTINGTPIKAKIAAYLEISQFTASNIVQALGNTPVNYATRATEDASGNTIKAYYAANLVYDSGTLVLKNGNNNTLSTITGANILGMLGLQTTDTIATQAWVGNQGFLTASAISDMATKTWVGQQGYLTASSISDMATKTWVGQQGYITSSALSGYATQTWVGQQGYLTDAAAEDKYLQKTQFIASNIVDALGTTPVNRATADASGNTITASYLRKDTDDIMSANLTIGSSSSTKTLMVYGSATFSTSLSVGTDATIGGNTTIGAKTTTSTAKALSVYGRNNSTNPALNIYGVYGNNSAYLSSLYTASDGLHITTALNVAGNITATGNIVAGTASDRRLKDHIKTMGAEQAIGVLKALRPVTFEWNDLAGELGGFSGDSRGFVADEYKDIIPNATRKIWGRYDAIDYQQAIPYLVAGWQALYDEVQRLKRRLGDGI